MQIAHYHTALAKHSMPVLGPETLREQRLKLQLQSPLPPLAQAEKAVERFEEAGAVLGDLGMALIRLAKFEAEQGTASAAYSATAAASRSLSADCQRTGKVWPQSWNMLRLQLGTVFRVSACRLLSGSAGCPGPQRTSSPWRWSPSTTTWR